MSRGAPTDVEFQIARERILDVAEKHFRHFGFRKTSIADIAKCMRMSSANIYRFFPSRMEINASICDRFFAEAVQSAKQTAGIRCPAQRKLMDTLTLLHQKRKVTFVAENAIHELMVAAAGENWAVNKAHTDDVVGIIEGIVREGVGSGEFEAEDPVRAARNVMTAFTPFYHPVLVEQDVLKSNDTGAHLRDQVEFLIKALGARP